MVTGSSHFLSYPRHVYLSRLPNSAYIEVVDDRAHVPMAKTSRCELNKSDCLSLGLIKYVVSDLLYQNSSRRLLYESTNLSLTRGIIKEPVQLLVHQPQINANSC